MGTPQERVVALAKSQVGYAAQRERLNKFAEDLDWTDLYDSAKNGYDWADVFYDWLLVSAFGLELAEEMSGQPSGGFGAGCDWSASYYRASNQWSSEPSIGAQVFFGPRGAEYHTGVVVGFDDESVSTVEGNVGYDEGHVGGAVLERTYSRGDARITGYGVPRWSMAGGQEPVVEITNESALHTSVDRSVKLEVDGVLGAQSIVAWQLALGTYVDGYVSGQEWRDWGSTPSLVSVERRYDAEGSPLVRTIQLVVGADIDGLMGAQTVRCLQVWLNAHGFECGEVDGVLGPQTAKAVQRSLNAGAWSR